MDKTLKIRSLLIGVFFFLLFFIVVGRIYWIQVVEAAGLREKAEEMWTSEEILKPVRGSITDRNGRTLAEEAPAYTVALNPQIIHDRGIAKDVAEGLAQVLKQKDDATYVAELEDRLYQLATKKRPAPKEDQYAIEVEVKKEGWQLNAEKKRTVEEFITKLQAQLKAQGKLYYNSVGVYLKETEKRYYPFDRLASQILGYVSKDEGKAVMGLEKSLDDQLTGTPGKLVKEKDLKGIEIPGSKASLTAPVDGNNVQLTIDQNIQYYLEKELRRAQAEFNPKSMTAIAVNPKTMEILGMASTPDFDPNEYWQYDQASYRNRAIADQIEPGSTFKIVTLAGAIEQGLWKPQAIFESGVVKFKGMKEIRDHNWIGWGPISFMEGLVRSSNVLFSKLGYEELGKEKFKSYVDKFGFGQRTGIDLSGEAAGNTNFRYESDYARATFGQSVSVTALQQAAAFAAIANDGKLMKPYIIKKITDPKTGKAVQSSKPEVVRQVVSAEVARQTSLALEHVMTDEHATGLSAAISGYRIAGKTGTANIVPEGQKTYADNQYVVSFYGYAPLEDPQILIGVIADRPQIPTYHEGGLVTLPVFKNVMTETLAYLGIQSADSKTKTTQAQATASVPVLTGLTVKEAKAKLTQAGLHPDVLGSGDKVTKQLPAPGTEVSLGRGVVLVAGAVGNANVPDLTGMSLRDAVEIATLLQIEYKVQGEGFVVVQKVTGQGAKKVLELTLKPFSEPDSSSAASASPSGGETSPTPNGANETPAGESNTGSVPGSG
ncbi:penicillin-binding transpeptidase domain-containing protein [Gorillibacterium timonense]|uniref:penicillin-binding transpeptidase domain-containing protein n=1 Tax=Gorillibacterium timonense TaxID=1689269 RepID=UPI00071E59A8|nr:penicillin-binding transpeptidase domain-containing protein [Gorillibacterium timonense]